MALEDFDEFELDEDLDADDLDWDDELDDPFIEFELEDAETRSGFPWAIFLATTVLTALGVFGVQYLRTRQSRAVSPNPWASRQRPTNPERAETPEIPEHGLVIENDKFKRADLNRWVRFCSHQIQRAVSEGATRPDEVIARVFYRCFPDRVWPPPVDSGLRPTYDKIVATAALNLDHALRPTRVQDANRRGIHLLPTD